jgi:ABC-type transporter Mla subunit MlaD
MTPQEFRRIYLDSQDHLGNNLQSLTNLLSELNTLVAEVVQSYDTVNTTVEQFLTQLESPTETETED